MFRINEADYEATKAKVAKISDRARKRGFTGSIVLTAERVVVESVDEFGFNRTDIWFDVTITGEPPRYEGWDFLATLDWDPYAGLIVRTAPGVDEVDRSQLKENFCDHCKTNRNRIKTYLVRNAETGVQVQVGSTCIKDFLGWDTGIVFLDTTSITTDLAFGVGSGSSDCVGTTYALAVAWALIKLDGYRPASSHYSSTKGDVINVLWPSPTLTMKERQELGRIRDLAAEATVRASECRAWLLSDEFTGTSDYVRNLKAIAAADHVSIRSIGFLASGPQAWARAQQQTLVKEAKSTSTWIGEEKQRITFTATIEGVRFRESDWGVTVLYLLRDTAGNVIKWFASSEALGDEIGRLVTLTATIKKLETFKDVKETVITRAKEKVA
jgi:hypothetical protein